jgi:uncharacterized protein YcfJ
MTVAPRALAVVLIVVLAAGCAPKRPVLYPNPHYLEVGEDVAAQDVQECVELAHTYGHEAPDPEDRVAGEAVGGSIAGAIVGGAVGWVLGNPGRGAGAGAAGGGAAGGLRGMSKARDPDPIEIRFVEVCLRDRGFLTVGWK